MLLFYPLPQSLFAPLEPLSLCIFLFCGQLNDIASFEKELTYNCSELTAAIELELNQKNKQLQVLIRERKDGEFSAEAKQAELERILAGMAQSFNNMSQLLGRGRFTEEQIVEFATQKG